MTFLQALILSCVEGITEFLPISSTGHLILAVHALGIEHTAFVKSFEIFIQLGAILAIVMLYTKPVLTDKQLFKKILVAFLPSMVVGALFYKLIKTYLLGNTYVTLLALFIGGVVLILLEYYYQKKKQPSVEAKSMTYRQAVLIGFCQSLAVIPGVSRAAATILGGMGVGLQRRAAVEFSFLLAVPTMLAATALDLSQSSASLTSNEYILLVTGFIGSFIFAFITVKWFAKFVQTQSLIPFGIYRMILAVVYFILIM